MRIGPGGGAVVIRTLLSGQILVQLIGDVKSQLLFGVRIELAVESLPYPHIPGSLEFQQPG